MRLYSRKIAHLWSERTVIRKPCRLPLFIFTSLFLLYSSLSFALSSLDFSSNSRVAKQTTAVQYHASSAESSSWFSHTSITEPHLLHMGRSSIHWKPHAFSSASLRISLHFGQYPRIRSTAFQSPSNAFVVLIAVVGLKFPQFQVMRRFPVAISEFAILHEKK